MELDSGVARCWQQPPSLVTWSRYSRWILVQERMRSWIHFSPSAADAAPPSSAADTTMTSHATSVSEFDTPSLMNKSVLSDMTELTASNYVFAAASRHGLQLEKDKEEALKSMKKLAQEQKDQEERQDKEERKEEEKPVDRSIDTMDISNLLNDCGGDGITCSNLLNDSRNANDTWSGKSFTTDDGGGGNNRGKGHTKCSFA